LIVEDQSLIAMAMESSFEDDGLDCATVGSSAEAMAWLEENTPSVAILDYKLKDGSCAALAEALRARGVPFLIYSGYPAQAACAELRGVPWIGKPAARDTLLKAIADLVVSTVARSGA
jgi:ActR/RegA family two-component response regulator